MKELFQDIFCNPLFFIVFFTLVVIIIPLYIGHIVHGLTVVDIIIHILASLFLLGIVRSMHF